MALCIQVEASLHNLQRTFSVRGHALDWLSSYLTGHRQFVHYSSATSNVASVYCGQMARWIKMPLGREVDLGPGDIVLDGDPAPPTGTAPLPHNFWPMSVVAKRLDISRCHLVRR